MTNDLIKKSEPDASKPLGSGLKPTSDNRSNSIVSNDELKPERLVDGPLPGHPTTHPPARVKKNADE